MNPMRSGLHNLNMPRERAIQEGNYLFDGDYASEVAVSASAGTQVTIGGMPIEQKASEVAASVGNKETSRRMFIEQKKIEVAQFFSRRYGLSSLTPQPDHKKRRVGSYCHLFDGDYASEVAVSASVATRETTRGMPIEQKASEVAVFAGNQETSRRMFIEQKKIEVAQLSSRRYSFSSVEVRIALTTEADDEKRCVGSYCPLDCLPESILHEILSRLSIPDLLIARQSCVFWHRIVSKSQLFQELYDERNHESWIAITSSPHLNNDRFVLLNANDAKQYHFLSLAQRVADPITKSFLLQGVAEGLMLLASREGRLAVANPLTRHFRLLPDVKLSSRLRLESCLKKKLWQSCLRKSSISINIVGDSASKSFRVMVWGELRNKQVHALVYSSITDTWNIQLCPEVDHRFFRYLSQSTTDGTTIYCNLYYPESVRPCRMVIYNTETHLSVVEKMWGMDLLGIDRTRRERVQTIGLVVYNSRIFLLAVRKGVVGLWEANRSAEQWKLLTKKPFDWGSMNSIDSGLCEAAASYDGKQSVSIIAKRGWRTELLKLNLDTKEWKWKALGGNPEQITRSTLISTDASEDKNEAFKAFQMELKFCTAM